MYQKTNYLVLLRLSSIHVLLYRSGNAIGLWFTRIDLSRKYTRLLYCQYYFLADSVHRHSHAVYNWLYLSRCLSEITIKSSSSLPSLSLLVRSHLCNYSIHISDNYFLLNLILQTLPFAQIHPHTSNR